MSTNGENYGLHVERGLQRLRRTELSFDLAAAPRADGLSLLTGGQGKAGNVFKRVRLGSAVLVLFLQSGGRGNRKSETQTLEQNFFFDLVQLSSHTASEWVRVMAIGRSR